MPVLRRNKDFQAVRKLPFCYLCGRELVNGDVVNADHVPPEAVFESCDRDPVLKLQTHKTCNSAQSVSDKKIAQLIALGRYRSAASDF